VESPRQEGTPQGGPLSPLLSNMLLDDLDVNFRLKVATRFRSIGYHFRLPFRLCWSSLLV
jgi:retron-type reverse transcriptase